MVRRFIGPFFLALPIHVGFAIGPLVFGCAEARRLDGASKPDGLEGTVSTLIVSYDDHAETFDRLVTDDGEEIALDFAHIERRARIGQRIVVRGARNGNRIAVSGYDVLRASGNDVPQPLRAAPGERKFKVAALLLTTEISRETLVKRIFTDPDSPAAFYRENSYGAWTLEGDVYGPYTIVTTSCRQSSLYDIVAEAAAAAKEDGFDPAAYDNLMYYIGEKTSGCTFAAAGEVGINEVRGFFNAKYSWYRESSSVALAQELGHNFGLLHAHQCFAPPYNGIMYGGLPCPGFMEYGDPYTPMGSACGHLNAPESAALGFISGCNTLDVTNSGTFEIGPIEAKCSGPQVLRIATIAVANHGPQYIYLEYRRGIGSVGSDTRSQPGIYFHASAEYGGNWTGMSSGDRHNLDYALDPFDIHEPLTTVDSTWTEPVSAANFKLTAFGETATVEVTLPNAGRGPVRCVDGSPPPSSPMCSMFPIDAGARDSGEGDVLQDAKPSEGSEADVVGDTGTDVLNRNADPPDAPTSASSDVGCSCRMLAAPAATRKPAVFIGMAAMIALRRRNSRRFTI
jgi:hypothetical protein